MRARALVAVLLIVLGAFPALPLVQAAPPAVVPVDLGYAPSTLFPAAGGTPVYTAGDQVWAMSRFNATVQVSVFPETVFAGPNPASYSKSLEPGVPARLVTVNSTDPQGLWVLEVVNSTFPPAGFVVSDAAAAPSGFALSAYGLSQGRLRLNFTTSPGLLMYGASACVVGGEGASVARIPVPAGVGSGYVNVSRSYDSLQAVPSGAGNYSLSVQLYRPVSFLLPGSASTLVSRLVQVGGTDAVPVSGGTTVTLSLRHGAPLRPGVYQVRAIFEGAAGVFLSPSDVILTAGGGWVWVGGCASYAVYSNDFEVSPPLGPDPGTWPRAAWLTYEAGGVQGVAYLPLKVNLSAVDFVGEPWGVSLSAYTLGVNSTSGVQAYEAGNGTIFAVLDAPAGELGYELGLGGHRFFAGTAGPLTPFAVKEIDLNVSKLVVQYQVAGSAFAGGTVRVSDSTGPLEKGATGSSGEATFYLPSGRYNVTATGGNSTASGSIGLTAGQSQRLVLGAANGNAPEEAVLVALGLAAAVGAVANVALWMKRRERPGRQGDGPSQK